MRLLSMSVIFRRDASLILSPDRIDDHQDRLVFDVVRGGKQCFNLREVQNNREFDLGLGVLMSSTTHVGSELCYRGT